MSRETSGPSSAPAHDPKVVAVDEYGLAVEDRIHVGRVFIDASLDRVDRTILRDRRRSAGDGIVVAVIAVDREGGAAGGFPEIVTRGFVPDSEENGDVMEDVVMRLTRPCVASSRPACW